MPFRLMLTVWILASTALAAQTVEGHVVNAVTGAGIAGAIVRIFAAGNGPARGISVTTDTQGRFHIDSLKEGAYRGVYSAPGFRGVPEPGDLPTAFQVGPGAEPVRLEVKMQPLGKLSGRVLDAAGKPVPNADLWLVAEKKWCLPPECFPRTAAAKTNDKGDYAFTDLVPGAWMVSATAPLSWNPPESTGDRRLGWAQTFYPGVTDPQAASAIALRDGGELGSLDIKLAAAPVHAIRGVVLDLAGKPVAKVSVALGKGFGPVLRQETGSDGAFEFAAVVDDEWRLSATADQGGVKLRGAQAVEVSRHDLENVELPLTAPFQLRGKMVLEVPEGTPAPPPPPIDLVLMSLMPLPEDGGGLIVTMASDHGNLSLRHAIYPGPYQLETLSDAPAPYYLDSIRLGGQDARGPVSILSDGQPLTVTYKLGGGTVRGTVEGGSGAAVLLIPQDSTLRRHAFTRIGSCDQNGRFELTAVRPGEYYGFAIREEPFPGILQDGSLLKQAVKVTVSANESTAADLRLIVP